MDKFFLKWVWCQIDPRLRKKLPLERPVSLGQNKKYLFFGLHAPKIIRYVGRIFKFFFLLLLLIYIKNVQNNEAKSSQISIHTLTSLTKKLNYVDQIKWRRWCKPFFLYKCKNVLYLKKKVFDNCFQILAKQKFIIGTF